MTSPSTGSHSLLNGLTGLAVAAVLALSALLGRRPSGNYLALVAGALGFLVLLQQPGLGLVALATLSFTLPSTVGTGTEVVPTPPVLPIAAVVRVWLADVLR
jgi:hypothetical protein